MIATGHLVGYETLVSVRSTIWSGHLHHLLLKSEGRDQLVLNLMCLSFQIAYPDPDSNRDHTGLKSVASTVGLPGRILDGIRTHNLLLLKQQPLPIGLQG